jgi:hypothetical protein
MAQMQLPAYQVPRNALLDLSPINEGFDAISRTRQQNQENQFRDKQFGLQERQLANQEQAQQRAEARQKAEALGSKALAFGMLPPEQRNPAAWDRVLREHPEYQKIPTEYRDPVRGPSLVAAEFGKYRDTLKDEDTRAGIRVKQAQASAYEAAARAKGGTPQRSGLDNYGLDDKGALTFVGDGAPPNALLPRPTTSRAAGSAAAAGREMPPQIRNEVLGASETAPGTSSTSDPYNPNPTDVIAGLPADPRERLKRQVEVQRVWTSILGEAPKGQMYLPDGSLTNIRNAKQGQQAQVLQNTVAVAQQGLDEAFKRLTDSYLPTRAAGGAADFGEIGQAYNDIEMSVRMAVYAMSGKTVTNKEFDAFILKFKPLPLDGAERIKMKQERLNKFLNSLKSKYASGVENTDVALGAAMLEASQGSGQGKVNPVTTRLKNKYGLE